MKKFFAIVVVLGLVALYWFGCQKKHAVEEPVMPEPAMEQPEEITPPPPPPLEAEGEGETESVD